MKTKGYFSLSLLVILLMLSVVDTSYSQNQQWPMVNLCRERTSWASDEDVLYPPLQKVIEYEKKSEGSGITDLTFYNNLLCLSVSGDPNMLEAIDVTSGDTLWTFPVPGSGGSMNFSGAQNDSLVFAGGQHGLGLYALNRQTGQLKWHKPIGSLFTRHIILDGDIAFIVTVDSLYCLLIQNGATVWTQRMSIQGTPAVDDNYVYVVGKYKIRVLNKLSGESLWEKSNSQNSLGGITVDESCFYTFSNDTILAYYKESREVKWFYHRPGATINNNGQNTFAASNSILCFNVRDNGEGNGQIIALNKATGDYIWEHTFEGDYVYAPVIANGAVYVIPSKEQDIYGFNLNTGEQIFIDKSNNYRNQPIVADHKLYVITSRKVIVFHNEETAVEERGDPIPGRFELSQNFPNPFNPETTIAYSIKEKCRVTLNVYNVQGKQVATITNGEFQPGSYEFKFNGRGLPSGIYFYRLQAGRFTDVKKMILLE